MIIILSNSNLEESTEDVIDWLDFSGAEWVRINSSDLSHSLSLYIDINNKELEFSFKNRKFSGSDVNSVWYRRWSWGDHYKGYSVLPNQDITSASNREISDHLSGEFKIVSRYLFSRLSRAAWLDSPESVRVNKLDVIERAAASGLAVPATIVTTDRDQALAFAREWSVLITKSIWEGVPINANGSLHMMYTAELNEKDIMNLPIKFGISMFQERLCKAYEVRVFYLDGKVWSMAIFSQADDQTSVDFRKYNNDVPNRTVPYQLPNEIVGGIIDFMNNMNLRTGSLDFVVLPNGKHVFLEVNPVGQFGMTSGPCNYHLDKHVAQSLMNNLHC